LAAGIQQAALGSVSEEDLKIRVERLLQDALPAFGIEADVRYETAYKSQNILIGRSDAVYGHVIIEYERVGTFRTEAGIRHAEQQLITYVKAQAGPHGLARCVGVGLDGEKIFFVRYKKGAVAQSQLPLFATDVALSEVVGGDFQIFGPTRIDKDSVTELLFYLRALQRRPLTAEGLVKSFGPKSAIARDLITTLTAALDESDNSKISAFYGEWNRIFGIIYGAGFSAEKSGVEDLRRAYDLSAKFSLKPIFFALHTFYAIVIKVLAIELLSLQQGSLISSFAAGASALPGSELEERFQDLEHGGLFARLGVKNFLEGDFFGWYLSVWSPAIENALRSLVREIAAFEPASGSLDFDATRDLLKDLYEDLVPRKLRHRLGEYYTPDWLAELTLDTAGYDGDLSKRLLDPSCGSGTFLVLAIQRARQYAEDHVVPPRQALESILGAIAGFDLNPLAVVAARTNYLLGLGSLIRHKAPIELPVYLCDALLTPARHAVEQLDLRHGNDFAITTSVGDFYIPHQVVEEDRLASVIDLIEESVYSGITGAKFKSRLLARWPAVSEESAATLQELFEMLSALEKDDKNGIWARYIENAFAPVFVGKFDFVVGNPPWIGWESVSKEYRRATASLWNAYGLFSLKGLQAIQGGGKKDLSMLFVYVSMDNYLRDRGRLTFLITESVLKSRRAGEGFRRFRISSRFPFRVRFVRDFSSLKPFQGASNRTVIFDAQRDEATSYPVRVERWVRNSRSPLRDADHLASVVAKTSRSDYVAYPVDRHSQSSAWLTLPAGMEKVRDVIGPSQYVAHAGATTWLNGVYFLRLVERRPDGLLRVANIHDVGDTLVKPVERLIEPDLVYPLARMGDVKRWSAAASDLVLVPQDPNTKSGFNEEWLASALPHTYQYLTSFESQLRKRPGVKRYHAGKAWYSIYNVGAYSFAPIKVVWPRMVPQFTAAIVGLTDAQAFDEPKPVITQEVVTEISMDSMDEAYFVCGYMNSSLASFISQSYATGKSRGSPSCMDFVNCPRYDALNPEHVEIRDAARRAVQGGGSVDDTAGIIDAAVARMHHLDDAIAARLRELLE
jgi:hypothetical protein